LKRNTAIIIAAVISLAGFVLDALIYYPGLMSPDSVHQLEQAATGNYWDWHPPLMAAFWRILNYFWFGPQPMLFFQLLLLWGSCFMLTRLFLEKHRLLVIPAALLFFMPYVQNFAGVIWKDIQMSAAWLFACVIMLNAAKRGRRMNVAEAVMSIILLAYGCWLRSNALTGLVALIFMWLLSGRTAAPVSRTTFFRFAAGSIVIMLSTVALESIIKKNILKATPGHISVYLYSIDLASIFYNTGDLILPERILKSPDYDTAFIRRNFRYGTFDNIWFSDTGKRMFQHLDEVSEREFRSCWISAIKKHPGAYLHSRTIRFLAFLRISHTGEKMQIIHPYMQPNKYGFTYEGGPPTWKFYDVILFFRDTPLMQPWFWFLLNIIILIVAALRRPDYRPFILALSCSSLLYILPQFFFTPADTEFRYFYWTTLSVSLSFILLLHGPVFRSSNSPEPEQ
jgi:hypothetical protein